MLQLMSLARDLGVYHSEYYISAFAITHLADLTIYLAVVATRF